MRVIVTRPLAQAGKWVEGLTAGGVEAVALPLLDIAPVADPSAVLGAWARINALDFVMFVSANAVLHFFALRPAGALWPRRLRAAANGPGTQAALNDAGLVPAQIVAPELGASQFDSEALWALIAQEPWLGRQVLVVRGEHGRDWLAHQWQEAGAQVAFVAAYRRLAPRWGPAQERLLAAALAEPNQHLWHFSSSQAIAHLLGHAAPGAWAQSRALATHPRIAQTAREAGFGQVLCVAPQMAAVLTQVLTQAQAQAQAETHAQAQAPGQPLP